MYRKLAMFLVVLLVAVTGCLHKNAGNSIVVSAMTATDPESSQNESVFRLGFEQELVEVFVQTHIIGVHGEDQFYSVGVAATLEDAGVLGQPYFGYFAGLPTENEDGGFHGPLAGTRYRISDNVDFVTEGWFRSANGPLANMDYFDEWKLVAGPRYRF